MSVEFEVMYLLALKEGYVQTGEKDCKEQAMTYRLGQRAYLALHKDRWLEVFREEAAGDRNTRGVDRGLEALLRAFTKQEAQRMALATPEAETGRKG